MANSKVIFGGTVLIDLTEDTVDAASLLEGKTAHGRNGEEISGACKYDADTSNGTAIASEILFDKVAYVSSKEVVGTMPNNGAVNAVITSVDEQYSIPYGFHDGSGQVSIDSLEKDKIISDNIREGVTILGVEGTMSGSEDVKAQSKTVTPTVEAQTILPYANEGFNYLASVIVEGIPYTETANTAGGITVTIG